MSNWRRLWDEGVLEDVAQRSTTIAEMADLLAAEQGVRVSRKGLSSAWNRLRAKDASIPQLSELLGEATNPGAPSWGDDYEAAEGVPEGFYAKGFSTLYDGEGNVRAQWVKTEREKTDRLRLLMETIENLPARGSLEPLPPPKSSQEDLLCVYPMGDPHLGLYAWHRETGEDFNLDIATTQLFGAVDKLVAIAPPAKTALIVNLGDFFHADNMDNKTARSGHVLDVDTRWPKVYALGIETFRRVIDRALLKHEQVHVICEIGNHDDHSAIAMALTLAFLYEDEPRVHIDTSPDNFHWFRFGECLIGVTHGNTVKAANLPGIMACDRKEDWGATTHRYWYTGHVHHDSAKEYNGCTVETFRTLAAKDKWTHSSGYRSGRDMKCDVLHRKYGRIIRNTIGIQQLTGGQP